MFTINEKPARFNHRAFVHDESGSIVVLTMFLIIAMIFTSGIGVDMARAELVRARFQSTLDRAVLAAADLDTCVNGSAHSREVFDSYLDTNGFGGSVSNVSVDVSANNCSVTADSTLAVNSIFLPLLGIDALNVVVASQAVENVDNVEISLILDVSYSMRSAGKIEALQPAARTFASTILDQARGSDTTTMNVVQFGGNVNPGRNMFDYLNGVRLPRPVLDDLGTADPSDDVLWPDRSSCLTVPVPDYGHTALPSQGLTQVPIFGMYRFFDDGRDAYGWCPDDTSSILYASNDEAEIHDRIDDILLYAGTGTNVAMKWGVSLLDPSTRPAFNFLATRGEVESQFSNRPLDFAGALNQKFIVLMTDGETTEQIRPSNFFEELNLSVRLTEQPGGRQANVSPLYGSGAADSQLQQQCELAKQQGIVVFTIGYQTRPAANAELLACASSPAHFYNVTGLDIAAAFQGISTSISALRLTN